MIPLYVRPVKNAFLTRERDIHVSRYLVTVFIVLFPTILLLLLLVSWQNQIYKLGYQLTLLEHNRFKLEEKKLRLLLERERLRNPELLESEATRLGLILPRHDQVVTFREP